MPSCRFVPASVLINREGTPPSSSTPSTTFGYSSFAANSAWTVIAALSHNLGRWTTQIGLPNDTIRTARVRRQRLLRIPGRLTRTARKWTLRMPARWPWQTDFTAALTRIRELPALT
ncbi:MAG: transposase [Solirubrobacteraceae bacterium]